MFIKYCAFSKISNMFQTLTSLGFPSVSVCVHNSRSNTSNAAELAEFGKITTFYGKSQYLMNTLYLYNTVVFGEKSVKQESVFYCRKILLKIFLNRTKFVCFKCVVSLCDYVALFLAPSYLHISFILNPLKFFYAIDNNCILIIYIYECEL